MNLASRLRTRRFRHPRYGQRMAVGDRPPGTPEPTGAEWVDRWLLHVEYWAEGILGVPPTLAGLTPHVGSQRLGWAMPYYDRLVAGDVPDDGHVVWGRWRDGTPDLVHNSELSPAANPEPELARRLCALERSVERGEHGPLLPAEELAGAVSGPWSADADEQRLRELLGVERLPLQHGGALAELWCRMEQRWPGWPAALVPDGRTPALKKCRVLRVDLPRAITVDAPEPRLYEPRQLVLTSLVAVVAFARRPVVWALDWQTADRRSALDRNVLFAAARRRHHGIVATKGKLIAALLEH